MLRFVDMTNALDSSEPSCAFYDTVRDEFLEHSGGPIFTDLQEICEHTLGDRMRGLLPDGFLGRKKDGT